MHKQEIEALVLSAVQRVINGVRSEDSRIECKGEWPDSGKARQLAAHANSAHGEEMVWIIGLDEKAGRLTSPEPQELANWWAQMESRFDDHVAPDMQDLIVQVTEDDFVTALVFSTDRAPYVIKAGGDEGRLDREVPIRDGTRTRSARRHELLRILHPAAVPPSARLISALISGADSEGVADFQLEAQLFIEQRIDEAVMIPYHLILGRLDFNGLLGDVDTAELTHKSLAISCDEDQMSRLGVHRRRDGLTIAGGAVLGLSALVDSFSDGPGHFGDCQSVDILIEFGVSGGSRPISVMERLRRHKRIVRGEDNVFARWSYRQNR